MRHPLQDIWDQRHIIANRLALIYSSLPMKGILRAGILEIIYTDIPEHIQTQIDLLREMDGYCLDISNEYFIKNNNYENKH